MPRLVVHADTTTANVHEAMRTEPIHAALAAKGLAPAEHLVDAAYTSAEQLVAARERHDIDLVGPQRRNLTWQSTGDGAFDAAGFTVDWDRQVACCPEGKESVSWKIYSSPGRARGHPLVHARFHPANCRACSSRPRCARSPSQGRVLSFFPRREQEALMAARARERTDEYRRLYAQRQGIEGTMSQGARIRLAPSALLRLGQNKAAARRHRCGHQPRPARGLVRQTPARTHPHFPLRRPRGVAADFANGILEVRAQADV